MKQHARQQAAVQRSARVQRPARVQAPSVQRPRSRAAPQSILRQAGQQRANNRSVKISDTCIARPFDKTHSPQRVNVCPEEVQDIPVLICRRRRNLRCLRWMPSAPRSLRKKLVASGVLELEACDLSARFDEPDVVVAAVAVEEEVQFEPQEEEEEDVVHVSNMIAPRKRRASLQRELAALGSELGVYWCETRLRRSGRVRREPVRFEP
eukprot:scaffold10865_cov89-Skeletonema_dohrnii-CCMP3373.AAC.1